MLGYGSQRAIGGQETESRSRKHHGEDIHEETGERTPCKGACHVQNPARVKVNRYVPRKGKKVNRCVPGKGKKVVNRFVPLKGKEGRYLGTWPSFAYKYRCLRARTSLRRFYTFIDWQTGDPPRLSKSFSKRRDKLDSPKTFHSAETTSTPADTRKSTLWPSRPSERSSQP